GTTSSWPVANTTRAWPTGGGSPVDRGCRLRYPDRSGVLLRGARRAPGEPWPAGERAALRPEPHRRGGGAARGRPRGPQAAAARGGAGPGALRYGARAHALGRGRESLLLRLHAARAAAAPAAGRRGRDGLPARRAGR